MRSGSFQLFLFFSLLFFSIFCINTSAQLVEQWRVELPQLPSAYTSEFHFDSQGNTYLVRQVDNYSQSEMVYYILKISKDGILEWQIEEHIADTLNIFFESSGGDTLGNTYLLGNMIDSLNWGLRLPWVTKYSPTGTKLFMQVVETGYDYVPYVSAYTVAPSGNIFASGTVEILEPPTNLWDYGYSMIISPGAVKIAEFRFNIQSSHAYQHPPLGPDLDENYLVGYANYVGTTWDTIRRHFVGHDQFLGVRWMVSSNPTPNPDPLFDIGDYTLSKKGNIYNHPYSPRIIKKYSPYFIEQWTKTYNESPFLGPENPFDQSILIWEPDSLNKLACYNSDGTLRWRNNGFSVQRIGPSTFGPENDIYNVVADTMRRINYLTGEDVWRDTSDFGLTYATNRLLVDASGGITYAGKERVIKFIQGLKITKPVSGDKFIAGQKDTIKWEGGREGEYIKINYSTDAGNSFLLIDAGIPENDTMYVWDVPDDLLTTKAMIKIEKNNNSVELAKSDTFKIKPYLITRLDENGDYIAYDINTDRWGFWNDEPEVWPQIWWQRFDYNGIDPITNKQYSRWQGDSVFTKANRPDFPDWLSFVGAFGIDACYHDTYIGIYQLKALNLWKDTKRGTWGGSCFGIAISNALAFEMRNEFNSAYPNFPLITSPILVTTDSNVVKVVSELFTHQFGNPHANNFTQALLKTPNQTLNELKNLLKEDNVKIRTLSFLSNDPLVQGGHAIVAYKIKQDDYFDGVYYIYVYDNSHPDSLNAYVEIDTLANGGNGEWYTPYAWQNWGGNKWLLLEDTASTFFANPILPKKSQGASPFVLSENELQVLPSSNLKPMIMDDQGNQTGIGPSGMVIEIPGSYPLITRNGSSGPPYGYYLQTGNYSIRLNNFSDDVAKTLLLTGNKLFEYERYDVTPAQTDRLFFDGGLSVQNPDQEVKLVKLINIINDTTLSDEKLFLFRELDLAHNDSIKIINPDNSNIDLISYGTQKNYQIELEYASTVISSRFFNDNIYLSANTTHKLVPNWGDFEDLQLTIYVDEGNNGTIDDTLIVQNQATDVGEDQGSLLPTEYKLEQNFPNPFNSSTVIRYSIPKEGVVTLKIYNAIGEEVANIVNETKQPGNYEATFITNELTSGVYLYQLRAGDFVATKKMILLK